MVNFLTYTDTVINPGPRMNVIIGPNGTGKSTIVNAVGVVFAGNLKLLGRSTDLAAYVKHGKNSASVEALVYDPSRQSGVRSVRRMFDSDGKGVFELDGHRVRVGDLKREINQRFDIQLDNLSQFMPQEKIADFVNMEPAEMLITTVRSLGGTEKVDTFVELVDFDKEIADRETEIEEKATKLNELKQKHEAEKPEMEAYLRQQEEKRLLDLLVRYVPVVEAREAKEYYIEAVRRWQDCEREVNILKQEMKNAEMGEINRCEQELRAVKDRFRSIKESCRTAEQGVLDLVDKNDDLAMRVSAKSRQLEDIESSLERRKKDIAKAEEHLSALEQSFEEANMDVAEHTEQEKMRELENRRDMIRRDMTTEDWRRQPLESKRQNASRQIRHNNQKLANRGNLREERIRQIAQVSKKRNLLEVEQFIRELRASGEFHRDVCGPVGAEIEVENQYHARIMESCCKGFYMSAFVTESSRDAKYIIDECRKKFGFSPDIISVPTTGNDEIDTYAIESQRPNRLVDDRLRSLGIVAMVDDIYKAPRSVRAALNAQAGLHLIHVGNNDSMKFVDQLRKEEGVVTWYAPNVRCRVLTSRYDRSVRNLVQETSFANIQGHIFKGSMEEAMREQEELKTLIREAEDEMRYAGAQLKELDARFRELGANLRETDREIRGLIDSRNQRKAGQKKIELARRQLEERRQKVAEMQAGNKKQELLERLHELQEEAFNNIPRSTKQVQDLMAHVKKLDACTAERVQAERALQAEKSKHVETQDEIKEKEKLVDKMKKLTREAKAEKLAREQEARGSLSDKEKEDNRELFNIPAAQEVETLREEIHRRKGQIAGLATGGQHMLDQFQSREEEIETMTREVQRERSNHQRKVQEFKDRKVLFLKWLEEGVKKMRRKFSSLYQRLGCSGDLELVNKDSDRLGDLKLEVLVSYREGVDLRPISAQANSGGEKMCCTMLFCFSLLLEEERLPPFVFVDELNQGLDYVNEGRIMRMMFEDAEKETAPQSFVITPKLLPDLPFHTHTKSHIIFNGKVTGRDMLTSADS